MFSTAKNLKSRFTIFIENSMARKKVSEMTPFEKASYRLEGCSWDEVEDVAIQLLGRCMAYKLHGLDEEPENYIRQMYTRILEEYQKFTDENSLFLACTHYGYMKSKEKEKEEEKSPENPH